MTVQACKAELAPIRPLAKFLCIKGVVFFTYWQGIGIAMAQSAGLIKARDKWTTYDTDDVAAGLQVCALRKACMHTRSPRDFCGISIRVHRHGHMNLSRRYDSHTNITTYHCQPVSAGWLSLAAQLTDC